MPDDPNDIHDLAANLAMSEPFMVIGRTIANAEPYVQNAWDVVKQHLATALPTAQKAVSDTATAVSGAAKTATDAVKSGAAAVSNAVMPKLKAEELDPKQALSDSQLLSVFKDPKADLEMLTPEEQQRLVKLTDAGASPMNFARVNGQNVPVEPEGSAAGRFAEGAAKYLNPITAVQGVATAVAHPIDTAKAQWDALEAQRGQAYELAKQGRYTEAVGHFAAGVLPFIGPPAAKAGERIASGDVAGGLGEGFGLLAPAALAVARAGVGAAVRSFPDALTGPLADAAEAASTRRIADVIAPKVGANKVRLGQNAADVAQSVAREAPGLTRSGIADSVAAKLEGATSALDEAADQRLGARMVPTQPVIDSLLAARRRLTAEAAPASEFTPQSGVNRPALGQDVVPAPNTGRVAQIDQAIRELKQLGPVSRYEPLRRIREAYDQVAKVKYNPSVTQDFLARQGEASGAADVTGSLRDYLAKLDPVTAKANADYSLWKKADTVLRAAEEVDRTRPTAGRTIMSRGLGAAAGAAEDGALGAVIGATLAPTLERLAAGVAPAMKIIVARNLTSLADALRAGQVTRAASLLQSLKALSLGWKKQAVVGGNLLSAPTPSAATPTAP